MTSLVLGLLAAAPHTVGVDLTTLDRASYQELDAVALERTVVVRLVQEGFAVVALAASPEVRLVISRRGRAVRVSAGAEAVEVAPDLRRLKELHLELSQKAVELARAAVARLPPEPVEPEKPPAEAAALPEPAPLPQPAPPPVPAEPAWQVLAAGGVLLRAPGIDGRVALAARYAAGPRLGFHLELGLSPIPGASFSAYDGTLKLGAGLQLTRGLLRLEVGLSLGAMLHVFSVTREGVVEPLGSRVDVLVRPFVRGTLNPAGGLLVWLQLGGGLTSYARRHVLLGVPLYERGALWLDLVLGLGWET